MTVVRTRFAPSPTGFLHIGSLRTALYAYALAKKSKGDFILRIEDTDQKREVEGAVEALKSTLFKFGLKWDEIYIQSKRKGLYQKAAQKLVLGGHAFYCQCPAKNAKEEGFSSTLRDPCRDKKLTSGAIKLRVPDDEKISYFDFVLQKEVSWDTNTVYDATLLKTDGFPTYHLAAMADDLDMKITHILRGHDWMPSTPVHLLVFRFLTGNQPQIGHLTDIQSPNGGKLSKRRDSVFCEQFINDGYLPEAILNFVILLGWAPKDNRELFTLSEFVQHFDPKGFQKSNPLFTQDKLNWLNGHYIRQKSDIEITQLVKTLVKTNIPEDKITQLLPLIKDRLVKITDFVPLTSLFFEAPPVDLALFTDPAVSLEHLKSGVQHLSSIDNWTKQGLELGWTDEIKARGWKVGDYFMSVRIAICGSRQTPPTTDTMLVLGKDETLKRLETAIQSINNSS